MNLTKDANYLKLSQSDLKLIKGRQKNYHEIFIFIYKKVEFNFLNPKKLLFTFGL